MISLFRATGPFQYDNVRWYAWFTIFFSARFYYPIFSILFLDLGLTLAEFGKLNAIWALTILCAEVPSGALADLIGRRKLLISAAVLMVLEMAVLLCAPQGAGGWLFAACAVNRVLSGLAEAAASGADEALAFDSLEKPADWDEVLEVTMRLRAGAMIVAMVVGAIAYDAGRFGVPVGLAHRLPIVFCFLQALTALWIAVKFREVKKCEGATFSKILEQTLSAARWVFTTKVAIFLVVGGLLIDGVVRNFATIVSEYYRLIEIPVYAFGFIAAGTSMLGMIIPKLSRYLAQRYSVLTNLGLTAGWVTLCLWQLGSARIGVGVLPAVALILVLSHLGFLMSRSLNQLASSEQRATVLSVKGLLFNLGYGTVSLCFGAAVSHQKKVVGSDEKEALVEVLKGQPWVFLTIFLIYLIVAFVGKSNQRESEG